MEAEGLAETFVTVHRQRVRKMLDAFFVVLSILFFAAAWWFVKGCQRL